MKRLLISGAAVAAVLALAAGGGGGGHGRNPSQAPPSRNPTPTASSVPGMLGVSERPDGTRQVTFDGKRLYSFTEDDPGEVTGDGFSDAFGGQTFTWHVVSVGGASDSGNGGSTNDAPFDY